MRGRNGSSGSSALQHLANTASGMEVDTDTQHAAVDMSRQHAAAPSAPEEAGMSSQHAAAGACEPELAVRAAERAAMVEAVGDCPDKATLFKALLAILLECKVPSLQVCALDPWRQKCT